MIKFGLVAFSALCIAAPFGAAAGTGATDDWNTATGGNSARNGLVQAVGPSAPDILWQGSRAAAFGEQPVILDNVAIMARVASVADEAHGSRVVAHDIHDGRILWETELPVRSPLSDWRSRVMGAHNNLVFATRAGDTNPGHVYALRVQDGTVAWRSSALIDESSTESPAMTDDGDLIVGSFSSLTRIDGATGATVWSVSRTSPSTDASAAAISGDRAYIWEAGPTGPRVAAFDLTSGRRLYASPGIGGGHFQQVGLLVGPDGTVYAPRTQNNTATDFFVALTDTGTGFTEKWRVPLPYVPAATFGIGPDGSVYSYSTSMELIRINPADGSVLNRSEPIHSDSFHPRMTIGADGAIYLTNGGRYEGRVYSFNADLSERWRADVPNVLLAGPALGQDGVLLVAGSDDNVFAFWTQNPLCGPDWNSDGALDVTDLYDFMNDFFNDDADYNDDGVTDAIDFFNFLTPFMSGC